MCGAGKSKHGSAGKTRSVCSLAVCGQFSAVLVQEWKDCEELKPKAKEEWTFRDQEIGGKVASDGVVCVNKQASVYEMRKE